MVFVPLGVAPCYRSWRMAGIRHLLMPPESVELVQTLLRPSPASSFDQTGQLPVQPIGMLPSAPVRAVEKAGVAVSDTPVHTAKETSNLHDVDSFTKDFSATIPPVITTGRTSELAGKLAYEQWPVPWQQRLASSEKHPVVVWSYAALKEDFSGQSDGTRAAFVRQLYDGMALRKGSHVLWPLELASDTAPRPDIFRAAMDILCPRVLVLLYDHVPDGLGIAPLACYQSSCVASMSGIIVLLGSSMETLVSGKAPLAPLLHIVNHLLGALPEGIRVR